MILRADLTDQITAYTHYAAKYQQADDGWF